MPYRALSNIHMGAAETVLAGELIPEHYLDMAGSKLPVNFDGLVETGDAEKISAAEAKKLAAGD